MILATFRAGTPYGGRTIEYESGIFSLQAFGPVALDFVLQADMAGDLEWAYAGLREWTRQFPSSAPGFAMQQPAVVAHAPVLAATSPPAQEQPRDFPSPSRSAAAAPAVGKAHSRKRTRGLVVVTAVLAIIAVAGVVVWHMTRPPALINFRPDGGKYATLQKALDAVKLGGTVRLPAGSYGLPAPITVKRAVHLEGAGSGNTTLRCASGAAVAIVDCPATEACSLDGIHFAYAGTAPGNAVDVGGGVVRLNDCQFSGAVGDGSPDGYGVSLEAPGVRASLTTCTAQDNSYAGYTVLPSADVSLNQCTATANGWAGLMLSDGNASSGAASATELAFTTSSSGSAHVTVKNGQFNHNKGDGVWIGSGAPSLSANQCMDNALDGIAANGQSTPTLQANECSENARSGIVFAANSAGAATDNTCAYNANNGITAQDHAQTQLSANNCSDNRGGSFAAVTHLARSTATTAPVTR